MSRENKKEILSKEEGKRNLLAKEQAELTALKNKVEILRGEGQEVEDLLKKIESIFKDIKAAERAIKDETRFNNVKRKILNNKKEVSDEIEKLSAGEKKAEHVVGERDIIGEAIDELEKLEQEDLLDLEVQAKSENDIEFTKYLNLYFDVEKSLEEFFNYLKDYNYFYEASYTNAEGGIVLLKSKEQAVEYLNGRKIFLYDLLKSKDYKNFDNQFKEFNDNLKKLYSYLEAEAENKKKELAKKAAERNELKLLYKECLQNFKLLSDILKKTGETKYDKEMQVLSGYLDRWSHTDGPREMEVWKEISTTFNKEFAELLAKLNLKIKSAYENGGVLPEEKSEKRDLSKDEIKTLEEAEDKWKLLKTVGLRLLSAEERKPTNEPSRIIEHALRKADEAASDGLPDVFKAQIDRFEYVFSQLLAKVPEDVKKEFENQLAGNAPSWEEKEKLKVAEEGEFKDKAGNEAFVAQMTNKLNLLEKILRQKYHKKYQTPQAAFVLSRDSLKMDIVKDYLKKASQALDDNDSNGYWENINLAKEKEKEMWASFGKRREAISKEFNDRLAGNKTPEMEEQKAKFEEEIKKDEEKFSALLGLMDERDKNLRSQFSGQIEEIKNDLAAARANLYDAEICQEKIFAARRGVLTLLKAEEIKKAGADKAYFSGLAKEGIQVKGSDIVSEAKVEPAKSIVAEKPAEKPAAKVVTSEAEPAVAGEIKNAKVAVAEEEKPTEKVLLEPATAVLAAPSSPAPKKGLWERFKGGIKQVFSRETGKVAGKVTYDTVASVLGLKLATDAVRWVATGKGDLADWWKGRKESKESVESVAAAYQSMLELLDEAQNNKILGESKKTAKRAADFRKKIESDKIPAEMRAALLERLDNIDEKKQEDLDKARQERDEAIRKIMETYEERKVSGLKIAKDALNFALTATGFSMLRGLMYAGMSVVERARKARKEFAKQTEEGAEKSELGFVAKDIMVNAAIETAHGLTGGLFSKEKLGAKKRTINFIKSLGTVMRGLGIYGVAVSDSGSHAQSIDKLIAAIKERGPGAISDNFIQNYHHVIENAERAGHLVTHPAEIFTGNKNLTVEATPRHEVYTTPEHHLEAPVAAPAAEHPAVPITAEMAEHGDHTVAIVELNNKEGILNGVNKIIHNNPDVFVHENGKAWSAQEIHTWKVRELKDMGFKIEGDNWGYPMTVHGGAKVEVFTDANGQPHFKLAGEEHVTFNKNYHWVETKPAEHVVAEHPANKSDQLINPYPENNGEVAGIEPAVSHAPTANADVFAEHPIAHKEVAVDSHIKEMAVAHHAPVAENVAPAKAVAAAPEKVSVVPEAVAEKGTLDQALKAFGYNKEEFMGNLQKMRADLFARESKSFIYTNGAKKFLHKIDGVLFEYQEHYKSALEHGFKLGDTDLTRTINLIQAEELYKSGKSDWVNGLSEAMFSKDDNQVMELLSAAHKNHSAHPILTNNSHGVRIWDSNRKKDVFWYEESGTFSLDKKGNLVLTEASGQQTPLDKQEALRLARK